MALALTSIGCESDWNATEYKEGYEEEGEVSTSELIEPIDEGSNDDCILMDQEHDNVAWVTLRSWPQGYNTSYPSTDWLRFCATRATNDDGSNVLSFGGVSIAEFEVRGFNNAVMPSDPLRVVGIDESDVSAVDNGRDHHYPNRGNYYSGWLTAESTGFPSGTGEEIATWRAKGDTDAEIGDLNACYPLCRWRAIYVEIMDYERGVAEECTDYSDYVAFCRTTVEGRLDRTSARARCDAGRGRFLLLPTARHDKNGDGLASYLLRPVQVAGTAQLTADASIISARLLDADMDAEVRMQAGPTRSLRITADDELISPNGRFIPLSAAGVAPSECLADDVAGSAPFVVERVSSLPTEGLHADLEWDCDQTGAAERVDLRAGASFSLSDLDCGLDWDQRIVLRTGPGSGRSITIEPYGMPDVVAQLPVTDLISERAIRATIGELTVEASVIGTADDMRTLVLDSITYRGAPLCGNRTIALQPE